MYQNRKGGEIMDWLLECIYCSNPVCQCRECYAAKENIDPQCKDCGYDSLELCPGFQPIWFWIGEVVKW